MVHQFGNSGRFCLLVVCSALTIFMLLMLCSRGPENHTTGFRETQCIQILPGMPRKQVESLLGSPPGDYTTAPYVLPPVASRYAASGGWVHWIGDKGVIFIRFDKKDRVLETAFLNVLRINDERDL